MRGGGWGARAHQSPGVAHTGVPRLQENAPPLDNHRAQGRTLVRATCPVGGLLGAGPGRLGVGLGLTLQGLGGLWVQGWRGLGCGVPELGHWGTGEQTFDGLGFRI